MATSPKSDAVIKVDKMRSEIDRESIQSIVSDLKSMESILKSGAPSCSRINSDESAAQSLLLLGLGLNETIQQKNPDLDAVDVLLRLHNTPIDTDLKCRHSVSTHEGSSILPEVSVNDLGALLDDIPTTNGQNNNNNSNNNNNNNNNNSNTNNDSRNNSVERPRLFSIGSLHEDDLLSRNLSLSSPTKARQLLNSIEDGSNSIVPPRPLSPPGPFLFDSASRPGRPVSCPVHLSSSKLVLPTSIHSKLRRSLADLGSIDVDRTIVNMFNRSFLVKRREDSQSEMKDGQNVDVYGKKLPLVDSPDLCETEPKRVFVSDVFKMFFSKRHFDTFRSILEQHSIVPVPIRPRGVGEALETITVDELYSLMMRNQARKDGYVKCLSLNSYAAGGVDIHKTTVINRNERQAGLLSSGIRTRHGESQDIGYVEIDNVQLPSLIVSDVQYVRLVDILRMLADRDESRFNTTYLSTHLNHLKLSSKKLSLTLHTCSVNDKARLVVVAHSLHHSSCLVLTAFDASKLVAYERQVQRGRMQNGKRPNAFDDALSIGKRQKRDYSPTTSSIATDDNDLDLDTIEEASSSSGLTSPVLSSRPNSVTTRMICHCLLCHQTLIDILDHPFRPSTPENCSRTLPFLGRDGLDRRKLSPLLALLTPLTITIAISESLPVLVVCPRSTSARLRRRGPTGYYLDHLFVHPTSQCIRCQVCYRFITIVDFLTHFHGVCPTFTDGRLTMLCRRRHGNDVHFRIWSSLHDKLRRFHLAAVLPSILSVSSALCLDRRQMLIDRRSAKQQQQQQQQRQTRPADEFVCPPLYRLTTPNLYGRKETDRMTDGDRRTLARTANVVDWTIGRIDDDKQTVLQRFYGLY